MAANDLNLDIGIHKVPDRHMICIHHYGPYAGNSELFAQLFARIFAWAGPRNLITPSTECIAFFHNDPEITDPEKLRMSIGLTVPPQTSTEGEVESFIVPAGNYAVATGKMRSGNHATAWWELMAEWLPRSGWRPSDAFTFEVIRSFPSSTEDVHHVELWAPVQAVQRS